MRKHETQSTVTVNHVLVSSASPFYNVIFIIKFLSDECLGATQSNRALYAEVDSTFTFIYIYSLRHRKCGVQGYMHELFVSKTRTSEGF